MGYLLMPESARSWGSGLDWAGPSVLTSSLSLLPLNKESQHGQRTGLGPRSSCLLPKKSVVFLACYFKVTFCNCLGLQLPARTLLSAMRFALECCARALRSLCAPPARALRATPVDGGCPGTSFCTLPPALAQGDPWAPESSGQLLSTAVVQRQVLTPPALVQRSPNNNNNHDNT